MLRELRHMRRQFLRKRKARRSGVALSEDRFLRSQMILHDAEALADTLALCGFGQDILVRPSGQICVVLDGIIMDTEGTNRYFKTRCQGNGNQAEFFVSFLAKLGIQDFETFVDIGANDGEASLFFAKYYPGCRIVSVEPSPKNLQILHGNIAMQMNFDATHIDVQELALSDSNGRAQLSDKYSRSSLIGAEGAEHSFEVTTRTLHDFWQERALNEVDLVKMDIEGAEVRLVDDLISLARKSRAWVIEFGNPDGKDAYERLVKGFEERGFAIYAHNAQKDGDPISISAEEFSRLASIKDDYWFIRQD